MNCEVHRAGPLLERTAELSTVEELLAAAASGEGRVLLLEGPAGIGKTRLVSAARDAAAARGFRVLGARASSLEAEFAFGVVRDLLRPVLRDPAERDAVLHGAARLAAPVLDLGETASPSFTVLHGLYWLVEELAQRQPLLLTVDDAHWADASSLRALHHLAHRISDLPVLLTVATRPPEPGGVPAELLEALGSEPPTTVLRPGPLSEGATTLLLEAVFGTVVDRRFAAACYQVSEGNPLLLDALARSLRAARTTPDADATGAVHDRAPAIVGAFVLPLLRQLPQPAVTVARALAVLGPGAELRFLAGVAGIDVVETARGVDRLVTAGLVVPDPHLDFAHPLLAQAVTDHMPLAERQLAHRTAAQELAADGLPAEAVAAHLLQVPAVRDPWVVERLREAAREAFAKGAHEPAVTYLERALAEPPARELRPEVLSELGDAETRLGRPTGSAHLTEALEATADPTARATVALRLARGLLAARELPRALDVLSDAVAAADAADVEPGLRQLLEAEYIGVAVSRPRSRADALTRLDRLLPDARPDTLAGCMLLATASVELLQVPGRATEAVDRARDALTGIVQMRVPFPTAVLFLATPVLAAAGEIGRAMAAVEAAVSHAQARGAPAELCAALGSRAEGALRLGALLDAEADVRHSEELAKQASAPYHRRLTLTTLLPVLLERADLDGAERELEGLHIDAGYAGLLIALGELRLAQGRPDEALQALIAGGDRLEKQRSWTHPGLFPWRAQAALAHHRAGRRAAAREHADRALAVARTYAAPTATGVALRALGQITGDIDALIEAAAVLAGTEARLEHARALVELGAAYRRTNHRAQARTPLREGLDIASRLGATALLQQAVDELTATGARPRVLRRGVDALSPSERRVARLAAGGQSNRDIAQALFVTTKTVEVHLSACYRKLGIASRTELATLLR